MKSILASIILVLGLAANLWAQGTTQSNVDLSTVPSRDTVQLTIYNSEDLTLVRETRKVSFKKGVNPLQFSWANTLIDIPSCCCNVKECQQPKQFNEASFGFRLLAGKQRRDEALRQLQCHE